jgi:hypothetical protein
MTVSSSYVPSSSTSARGLAEAADDIGICTVALGVLFPSAPTDGKGECGGEADGPEGVGDWTRLGASVTLRRSDTLLSVARESARGAYAGTT